MKFAFVLLASLAKGADTNSDNESGFLTPSSESVAEELEKQIFSVTFMSLAGQEITIVSLGGQEIRKAEDVSGEYALKDVSGEYALSDFELDLEGPCGYEYLVGGVVPIPGDKPLRVLYEEGTVTDTTLVVTAVDVFKMKYTVEDFVNETFSDDDPFSAWCQLAKLSERYPHNHIIKRLPMDGIHAYFPFSEILRMRDFQVVKPWRFIRPSSFMKGLKTEEQRNATSEFLGVDVPADVSEITLGPISLDENEVKFTLKLDDEIKLQYSDEETKDQIHVFRGGRVLWDQEMDRLFDVGNFRRSPDEGWETAHYCLLQAYGALTDGCPTAASLADVEECKHKFMTLENEM